MMRSASCVYVCVCGGGGGGGGGAGGERGGGAIASCKNKALFRRDLLCR